MVENVVEHLKIQKSVINKTMAYKMKGSPAKMGTIHGTKGHTTALKWAQFIPAALSVLGSMGKKKDDNDESPAKKELVGDQHNLPEELKAKIEAAPTKQKKTYPKSYTKKDIEFLKKQREDIVRYEDLDDKVKKMWEAQKIKKKYYDSGHRFL
jgi:hypothetical protein